MTIEKKYEAPVQEGSGAWYKEMAGKISTAVNEAKNAATNATSHLQQEKEKNRTYSDINLK